MVKWAWFAADRLGMTDDRALRQIRQEARLLQEELEDAVGDFAASERTLNDALIDYGKLGNLLRVEVSGRSVVGHVEHVGVDIVRLATAEGRRVDIQVGVIGGIRVSGGEVRPGAVSTGHPGTLLARLREAVQTQETIHLERRLGESIDGRIVAILDVAIEIEAQSVTWIVPMGEISYLWRV